MTVGGSGESAVASVSGREDRGPGRVPRGPCASRRPRSSRAGSPPYLPSGADELPRRAAHALARPAVPSHRNRNAARRPPGSSVPSPGCDESMCRVRRGARITPRRTRRRRSPADRPAVTSSSAAGTADLQCRAYTTAPPPGVCSARAPGTSFLPSRSSAPESRARAPRPAGHAPPTPTARRSDAGSPSRSSGPSPARRGATHRPPRASPAPPHRPRACRPAQPPHRPGCDG